MEHEAKPKDPACVRVAPGDVKVIAGARVANRTATSIEVTVGPDGTVTVTNCCLEEQGE